MTPTEALTEAEQFVSRLTVGAGETSSDVVRTAVALAVAQFLLDNEAYIEPEPTEGDVIDTTDSVPAGPARKVMCAANPGDYAYVRSGRTVGGSGFVGLVNLADGETTQVVLSPADARRYAAGILDAADEADGTSPLLWLGKGDDGPQAVPA
ncbi:hypothetical protein AB0H43_02925 [Hamadaea sp. NPDC050747]|uniref:hypothetical protein n=1 Tax=Hamadaea sp. NPDC050747 TaxID=3155789 RepID=UPI0033F621B2